MRFFFAPICVHIGERSVLYISIRSLLFPLFDAFPFSCLIETWGFRLTSVYGPSVFSLFFCPSLYKTQLERKKKLLAHSFFRALRTPTHIDAAIYLKWEREREPVVIQANKGEWNENVVSIQSSDFWKKNLSYYRRPVIFTIHHSLVNQFYRKCQRQPSVSLRGFSPLTLSAWPVEKILFLKIVMTATCSRTVLVFAPLLTTENEIKHVWSAGAQHLLLNSYKNWQCLLRLFFFGISPLVNAKLSLYRVVAAAGSCAGAAHQ